MKKLNAAIVLISLIANGGVQGVSAASMFTGLHVFGDSLSDTGNVYTATGGLTPPAPFYEGRFSNGRNWVEQLATDHLGLPAPTPGLAGGANHAWGGAYTAAAGDVPSVLSQVNMFIAAGGGFGSSDLVILWGGANDFLSGGVTDPASSVGNLSIAITALVGAGAETILVPNLPDLSDTPAIRGLGNAQASAGMHGLTVGFNALLEGELASLRDSLGAGLVGLDIYTLGKQITTDPGSLGLANGSDSALLGGILGEDANSYAYWDTVHPTEAVHGLFAERAAMTLGVPEPSSALLLWVGLSSLLWLRKRQPFP